MKKTISLAMPVLIFLAVVLSGCGVESVNPPTASTGAAGAPTTVQVTLSASSIAPLGTATVTATVTNASAQVVPNVSVSFSVISAASGSCTPTLAVTNASGQAVSTFNAANVDVNATIRATVTVGTSTIIGSAPITIGTPPLIPASVVVSLGTTTIVNGGNTTVSATVRDASSVLISGVTVTFTGAGNFTPAASATTDAFGVATVTFTANSPAGDDSIVNITATVGSLNNSASLTIGNPPPPTPASMSLTINPLSISISAQAAVSVTLLDASGNPAYNNPVTLTITVGTSLASFASGTTVTTVPLTTNASGIASATLYAGTSSGTVTVTATSTAPSSPIQASILITSPPASLSLNIVNPNLTSGQTTNITADVRNIANNPVSDGTVVTFAITSICPCAGSFSGQVSTQASTVNGIASVTFTASTTVTGGVIVQASVGTLSPVQAIIIVSAAQAGSLQFISVSPAIGVINIGGDSAILTFKVLDVNGTPLSGQTVNFQLAVAPTGATLSPLSGSTNGSGLVTTTLTSGPVAGPVRIDATTTVPGPPVTTLAASSGALSIGGGMPSMRFLSLSVQKFNVAGLNCDGVTDQINVRMADRFGNYNIVQGTSVSFATAYGAIDASNVTDASGATSSLWHSQDPRPANGLVAILVQTTGEENFVDLNGNGVYDLVGDTFIASDPNYDLPEPFIDNDGNGTHIAGELFFNWPAGVTGNDVTQYDGPNDVWDARIPIFKNVYIWMTGPPAVGAALSHIACCDPAVNPICASGAAVTTPITIPAGGSTVCYVYSSDVNNNALIGGTTVSMNASTTDATITNYSGFTTFVDHIVTGPEITGFLVRNTAAAPPVNVILSATINWTGTCEGNVNVPFSYPGTVTLQPAPPAAPAGVIATAGPGAGEITITWNAVSGATSYNLYWGTAPGATTNQITGVASPYVHTGRTTGTTYYYAVTAVNTGGESAKSSEVNAVAP